jgi:hypothetical protein
MAGIVPFPLEVAEPERRGANMGRFIVVRQFIIVAPFPDEIDHVQMVNGILCSPKLLEQYDRQIIKAEAERLELLKSPKSVGEVTDAGRFQIPHHVEGSTLILSDGSDEFGTVDQATRELTGRLFRQKLGLNVEVVAAPLKR